MAKKDVDLSRKRCRPCEGTEKPLPKIKIQMYLKKTPDWSLAPDSPTITRSYVMKNFMSAVKFILQVAAVAEAENHHPDIHLTGYRQLRIELSTHAIHGLSENDFILAAKINQLIPELKT